MLTQIRILPFLFRFIVIIMSCYLQEVYTVHTAAIYPLQKAYMANDGEVILYCTVPHTTDEQDFLFHTQQALLLNKIEG